MYAYIGSGVVSILVTWDSLELGGGGIDIERGNKYTIQTWNEGGTTLGKEGEKGITELSVNILS